MKLPRDQIIKHVGEKISSVNILLYNYRAEVYIKIITFCESTYQDSIEIARGVVHPIRFLDYNLVAMPLGNEYIPKQEIQSFEEKGEVKLSYLSGDANIFENVGRNASELKKLRDALDEIDANSTKKLGSFRIFGYTSPEGTLLFFPECRGTAFGFKDECLIPAYYHCQCRC